MPKSIGIDLGTVNSCAAIIENNQPKIILYKGGSNTIPSIFAIDEKGRNIVGVEAKRLLQMNPGHVVLGAKRLLGRSYHSSLLERFTHYFPYNLVEGKDSEVLVKVKEKVYSLEYVTGQILQKIKALAEDYLQDEVRDAVVTVPAYFNERQRTAVKNACILANLNILKLLNEPTAAALTYGLGKKLEKKIAVYDLGGGTFDISIIDIKDRVFEVLATGGDTLLGGIDFDTRITNYIIERFKEEHGIDLSKDHIAIQRIRDVAERTKINLSTLKESNIDIPFIARGPSGVLNIKTTLTREKLEEITHSLVEKTIQCCQKVLEEADLEPGDIDEVLLVGGQSRMPLVREMVKRYFGKEPSRSIHPDEAVAVGAAIMAWTLTHKESQKLTLLDVLPMSIGIAKVDGSFIRLFPKNSPIPSYKSLVLTNYKDYQKSIMLKIYQGDDDIASKNEILGTFIFSGIREAERGKVRVEVIFHIDSEGLLTVSARDKDTGQTMETVMKVRAKVTSHPPRHTVSDVEIKEMVAPTISEPPPPPQPKSAIIGDIKTSPSYPPEPELPRRRWLSRMIKSFVEILKKSL